MFGEHVRAHRQRLALTQEELTAKTGVSVRSIRNLEAGRVDRPRPGTVRLLADAFALSGADRDRFCRSALGEADRPPVATQPATGVVPAQLPSEVAAFTGRDAELRQLNAFLEDEASPSAAATIIAGMAGVGKTALAVRWANQVRHRFPDGQLYLDLRGHATTSPVQPIEALARFLQALSIPAEKVPTETEEAAALYRTVLADKRMLVVLDNAADPDQIRPLLPGSGRSFVLVTSRNQLAGLIARDGAHRLDLDMLTPVASQALLTQMLGTGRTQAEPAAVVDLANLCEHLPLALRIAAANLASHPRHRIAEYVEQLRSHDRITALAIPGDPHSAVPDTFDLSFTRLPAPSQRMFRLLGLTPGPDTTHEAAAALADIDPHQARGLLGQLAAANLIREHAPGRYTCHDLLRRYASQLAGHADHRADRAAAYDRLFAFYLSAVDKAAQLLYPAKLRLPVPVLEEPVATVEFRDHAQALSWLDGELPGLVAAVGQAAECGQRSMAWRLADALRGYFMLRPSLIDWLAVGEAALAAAKADDDPDACAAVYVVLASAQSHAGRRTQAITHYQQALRIGRRVPSPMFRATIMNNLGLAYEEEGRLPEAAEHYQRALTIDREHGLTAAAAIPLGNLAGVYRAQGRLALACEHHRQALAIHRQAGNRVAEAAELRELGNTYHAQGQLDQARDSLAEALALHQLVGDRNGEAAAQRSLAAVHRDAGQPSISECQTAVALARDLGSRRSEADALIILATVELRLGQPGLAIAHHEQALAITNEIASSFPQTEALVGLGTAHHFAGDLEQADQCLSQALILAGERGFRVLEGQALTELAAVRLAAGDTDRAATLCERAMAAHRETGHRLGEARTHQLLDRLRQCRT